MKRIFTILLICILLLTPTSLAYWQGPLQPIPKTSQVSTTFGTYKYHVPAGSFEWEPNKKYKQNDVILRNGIYYIISNEKVCNDNGSCPDPGLDYNPHYTPYTPLTIQWYKKVNYKDNDVVLYNDVLYRAIAGGSPTGITPGEATWKSWTNLESIVFKGNQYLPAGSYTQVDKTIILLNAEVGGNVTSVPNWAVAKRFNENYTLTKTYELGDAVFHEQGVYIVKDKALANKNVPGSVYGAWQRIDNANWYPFNIYKKGDIVRHNGSIYRAYTDNTKAAPNTTPYTWETLNDIKFNTNSVYKKDDVVIHNNIVYYATEITSGIEPGKAKQWRKN